MLTKSTQVRCKSHRPDPHLGGSDIWQDFVCRRGTGHKKYRVRDFASVKRQRSEALGLDAVGIGKATSCSSTDNLTGKHRLTLHGAHLRHWVGRICYGRCWIRMHCGDEYRSRAIGRKLYSADSPAPASSSPTASPPSPIPGPIQRQGLHRHPRCRPSKSVVPC